MMEQDNLEDQPQLHEIGPNHPAGEGPMRLKNNNNNGEAQDALANGAGSERW